MASFSKDSRSMTWHQWHVEYPMERKMGLSSRRAFSKASAPTETSHRVVGVLQQVGPLLTGKSVVCMFL